MRYAGDSPGAPGGFVVERGDELLQSVTGRIDMGAQLGDFGFERLGSARVREWNFSGVGEMLTAGSYMINILIVSESPILTEILS